MQPAAENAGDLWGRGMKEVPNNRIFAVPYNGEEEFAARLCDHPAAGRVLEVYGSDGDFSSGRLRRVVPSKQFSEDLKRFASRGIQFNYLLNALSPEDYCVHCEQLEQKLAELQDRGVHTLTVSHPFLAEEILSKQFSFTLSSSLNQFISSVERARILEKYGYKRILVDEDELRNLPLLGQMRSRTSLPLEVIVNNACVHRCPNRLSHQAVTAVVHPDLREAERLKTIEKIRRYCSGLFSADPLSLIFANWIRPEDLGKFVAAGVSIFKLAGRTFSTAAILRCLDCYCQGHPAGPVYQYLRPENQFLKSGPYSRLDGAALEPYFAHVWAENCVDSCDRCIKIAQSALATD